MFGRKKPNTNQLFDMCMKQGTEFSLKASDISTYMRSPFHLYCNYFANASDMDPRPDQYMELLAEAGTKHEKKINQEQFPDATPMQFITREEGFKMVLDSMAEGISSFLSVPLFYLPDGMHGTVDQLIRAKGKSIFGSYHYTIRETKLAKNIKKSHILQAAFYNHIIGKIQGYTPNIFHIINMEKNIMPFVFADYKEELFRIIGDVSKIRRGVMPTPTFGSCYYPWSNYCNKMAIESKDISLINGIGPEKKILLEEYGIKSIEDILACGKSGLEKIPGIGEKTAQNYTMSAKALVSNKILQRTKNITLPQKTTDIFIDLEGLDTLGGDDLGDTQIDYLIGVLICKGGHEKYVPFIAHDLKEEEMLNEFLEFMKKQNDYVMYHWHHYDRTHLTKMMNKYSISQQTKNLVLSGQILFDLHKITTEQFVFPFPGTGLKTVAKHMGFVWKHPDVNAMNSIILYRDYIQNANKDHLDLILDYNRDDCKATKIIKDWLEKQNPAL